jgi:Fe-S-cluster containining protein
MLEELFRQIDTVMEPILGDIEVQCRSCPHGDACCWSLVTLGIEEAKLIVRYLRETDQWEAVYPRLKVQARRSPPKEVLRVDFTKTRNSAAWKWFVQHKPCALYDSHTKRCRVYPVRPMGCRSLFAPLGTNCRNGESSTTPETFPLVLQSVILSGGEFGELASLVLEAARHMP